MKKGKLTNEEIGAVSMALAQLCHAGIGTGDALALMAEDEQEENFKELFTEMSRQADEGASLAQIFRQSGCFPDYVCGLMEVGERVGKTEDTLTALARYYESRGRLERSLKSALLYPAVLLVILLAVVVILLVWVLPVFDEVYAQLGSGLTGIAGGLLALGKILGKAMPWIFGVLAVATVILAVPAIRKKVTFYWKKARSDKGINRQVNNARFIQALSMALSSGLTEQEGVELAASLAQESEAFQIRCRVCLAKLDNGTLVSALRETELLTKGDCRLLEAAQRGGSGETMLETIAQRLLEDSEHALEEKMGKIEPALVAILSALVGAILLSVMLPLMNIMTAIG